MKKLMLAIFLTFASVAGYAATETEDLMSVYVNLDDRQGLQQGAATFANYCLSCHSIKYMRYNRMGEDLGIGEEVLRTNFLQPSQRPGDTMSINMAEADAKRWFGTAPPDLSLIARSRSAEWIYTFLLSFQEDEKSATGWNNELFKDVAMPHVLYAVQRNQSPEEYAATVRDLTSFLVYVAEPVKLVRYQIGIWVLVFMVIFAFVAYLLKKEYWKDIH